MTVIAPEQGASFEHELGLLEETENLLGSFLRAVSHDLKTPLLTLSLSAELLGDVFPGDERGRVAREAMTHGISEMERMLDAVTAVSRARRRPLEVRPTALGDVLHGHVVLSEDDELARLAVGVDGRSLREAVDAIGAAPVELRLETREHSVRISASLPVSVADVEGSCVAALLGSLQRYAGTPVAALAAAEVTLVRQGGALSCGSGRAIFDIPIVDRPAMLP